MNDNSPSQYCDAVVMQFTLYYVESIHNHTLDHEHEHDQEHDQEHEYEWNNVFYNFSFHSFINLVVFAVIISNKSFSEPIRSLRVRFFITEFTES